MIPILEELYQVVFGVWVARYAFAANIALQFYNYSTTIDQETYFFTSSKGISPTVILFLANRYLPFVNVVVDVYAFMLAESSSWKYCNFMFAMSIYLVSLQFIVAESTLFYRTSIVWMHNKLVDAILILAFLVGAPLGIYSAYEFTHTAETHNIKFKSPGCLITQSGSLTRALVVVTATEIVSVILIVCRAVTSTRTTLRELYSTAPDLLRLMIKDGIAYFICIAVICMANTISNIMNELGKNEMYHIAFIPIQATLQNILCVRLILHVRVVHHMSLGEHENELSMMVAPPREPRKYAAASAPRFRTRDQWDTDVESDHRNVESLGSLSFAVNQSVAKNKNEESRDSASELVQD